MLTTSEPAFGSLIASAPTCSPDTSLGRYFAFCPALPLRCNWLTHRFECAPKDRPTAAEAREISSMATMCARYPSWVPPYSSLTVSPRTPRSPSLRQRWCGKRFSSSIAAARGAISSAANLLTVSRSMSISSPCEKFSVARWPIGISLDFECRDLSCLCFVQFEFFDHAFTHHELLSLARDRHRHFFDKANVSGDLVVGDLIAAELSDVVFGAIVAGLEHDPRAYLFAVFLIRDTTNQSLPAPKYPTRCESARRHAALPPARECPCCDSDR